MNRIIKFRGQTIGGEWVTGNLSILKKDFSAVRKGHYISNSTGSPFAFMIRPETVGEFTGFKDINGKELFEGDKYILPGNDHIYTVVFFDGAFYGKYQNSHHRLSITLGEFEIIGSIHTKDGGQEG